MIRRLLPCPAVPCLSLPVRPPISVAGRGRWTAEHSQTVCTAANPCCVESPDSFHFASLSLTLPPSLRTTDAPSSASYRHNTSAATCIPARALPDSLNPPCLASGCGLADLLPLFLLALLCPLYLSLLLAFAAAARLRCAHIHVNRH